ncbi:MAG: hypothetical protein R2797_03895 [Gelidibacter sp.]
MMEIVSKKIPLRHYLHMKMHELIKYSTTLFFPLETPEKKFILYGSGRTGSTLFASLLNEHPSIFCDYEIFREYSAPNILFPHRYLKIMSTRGLKNDKAVYGCQLMSNQLKNQPRVGDQIGFLKKYEAEGWKILYIKRENVFLSSLSLYRAYQDNIWQISSKNYKSEQYSVDIDHLDFWINNRLSYQNLEKEVLSSIPHLEIIYERDLENSDRHQETMNRVFEYLHIESMPVVAGTTRKSSKDLRQDILNYDELVDYLQNKNMTNFL